MSTFLTRMSSDLIRAAALLAISALLPSALAAPDCPSAILQTTAPGAATRIKVGFLCGSPCPKYYLQQKTGYFFHRHQHSECNAPNYIYDFDTLYENYDLIEIDPDLLATGGPAPDGCTPYTPKSTSRHVGNYHEWIDCTGSSCNGRTVVAQYTQDAQGVWRDSNGIAQTDPRQPGWDGPGWVQETLCNRQVLKLDVTSASTCPNSKTDSTHTQGRNGAWLDKEYTTEQLTLKVDALARARIPNLFAQGDPTSTRTINANEDCATAMHSKWRVEIHGTEPGAQYEISWTELLTHPSGKNERRTRKSLTQAPSQSVWHFPSAAGELIAPLPWPKGCPENGGSATVTISQVKIVLVHSPADPGAQRPIIPPGTGAVGIGSIADCETCPEQTDPALPPGVHLTIGLGQLAKGGSAGQLYISEFSPVAALSTPALLQFSGIADPNSGIEIIRDPSGIQQIVTPQSFATVTALSSRAYQINVYRPEGKGVRSGSTYAIVNGSANLLASWTIENPDALAINRLRITESPTGGSARVWLYTFDSAAQAWTLATPSNLANERLFQITDSISQTRTEKLQRLDSTGAIVYESSRLYQKLSWGDALMSETIGTSAAARSVQWTYFPDALSAGYTPSASRPPVKAITRWDGSWQHYRSYDSQGRPLIVLSGFDSALTDNAALALSTEYFYVPVDPADTGTLSPTVPRRIVEKFKGTPISMTYRVFKPGETRQVRSASITAQHNASGNLTTVTRYFTTAPNTGRIQSIEQPDGTLTSYTYSETATSRTITTSSGQPDSAKSTILNGSQTVTVTGDFGQLLSVETKDISNGSVGAVLSRQVYSEFDSFRRPQRVGYLDNTFERIFYACCGVDATVDRDGTPVQYSYDALKRQTGLTRNNITHSRVLNAAGQVLRTIRIGSDSSQITLEQSAYDTAGQLTTQINALNGATTFAESILNGLRQRTLTYPDGGTRIELFYRDGRLAKLTGTAVRPVRYDYLVESDEGIPRLVKKETKLDSNYADTPEWTRTYHDFFGRPYKAIFAGPAAPYPFRQAFFNSAGQLWKEIDPDGVITLYQHNARGQLEYTAVDLNRNNVIDFSGTDRITRTVSDVIANYGTTVRRTRIFVWGSDYSDSDSLYRTIETSVDGLRAWTTIGGATRRTERSFAGNGNRYETVYAPDGSSAVSHFQYGRLLSVTQRDASANQIGQQTFTYDAHDRPRSLIDARTGAATYTFNNADQVLTATTPAPASGQAAQTTSATYNSMLQVVRVTLPDGTSVNAEYFPSGDVKKTWGSRSYPVEHTYDAQGRTRTMKTWRNFSGNSGVAITTWLYEPYRGFLNSKRDANYYGPTYLYTPAGRLASRTWARGVVSNYSYDNAGELQGINYSDGTPAVTYTYDRRGRLRTANHNSITTSFACNNADQVTSESHSGGLLNGLAVNRTFDSMLRPQSVWVSPYSSATLTSFSYDNASRLQSVSDGIYSAQYRYLANSPWVDQISFSHSGNLRLNTIRQFDNLDRLVRIDHTPAGSPSHSYAYQYNNAGQRTRLTLSDGSYWHYSYDALGQLTGGRRFWNDNTPVAGQQFEYAFDDIGNRISTGNGGNSWGTNLRASGYSVDVLNRYTSRTVPAAFDVVGVADPTATVTVNGQGVYRRQDYYQASLNTYNTSGPYYQPVSVSMGGPAVTGSVFVPQNPETFTYDADGNLTGDGRWTYQWDAENRLVRMESQSTAPESSKRLFFFIYDHLGRRIQKIVYRRSGGAWTATAITKSVYDGWNLLVEIDSFTNGQLRSYLWGLDLGGGADHSGSAGALLAIKTANGVVHFCTYDANGNLVGLVDGSTGNSSADYAYGPFGEPIRVTGTMSAANPFRWSTKYTDTETGLVYYGYRYYNPATGRWLSRDPIGELGGLNLYGFVGNKPTGAVDTLGLACGDEWDPRTKFYRAKGFAKGTWNQVEGLWNVVTDIPGTLKGTYYAIRQYEQTLQAIKQAVSQAVAEYIQSRKGCIDPCLAIEMEGKIASELATMFLGVGTISKAAKLENLSFFAKLKSAEHLARLSDEACCAVREAPVQLEFEFVGFVERQTLARDFYRSETSWTENRIASHMKGIDFNMPVEIQTIRSGTVLSQHGFPGDPTGNYFSLPGTPAKGLGIYPHGRVESMYGAVVDLKALSSIASAATDTWSVPGWAIEVPGGRRQYFIPQNAMMHRIP